MLGYQTGAQAYARDTGFRPDLLKVYRLEAGLTQLQLAHLIGHKSSSALTNWERGRVEPTLQNIEALARALGISRAALCEDPEE